MGGGPPAFGQGFTCPALLPAPGPRFPVRGSHPLWPCLPITFRFPGPGRLVPFRSPLPGESLLISLPPGTEMFQFPGFAPAAPHGPRAPASPRAGCPIRTPRDQCLFSAPPGFSQSTASFVASRCQGIRQTPFTRLIRPGGRAPGTGSHPRPPKGPGQWCLTWKDAAPAAQRAAMAAGHPGGPGRRRCRLCARCQVVEPIGIEPMTSRLQTGRSPV